MIAFYACRIDNWLIKLWMVITIINIIVANKIIHGKCDCLDGTQDIDGNRCDRCHPICMKCLGSTSENCTKCYPDDKDLLVIYYSTCNYLLYNNLRDW